jgi:hypothetical protein
MNFYNPWTSHHDQNIKLGEVIEGNVTLVDSDNNRLSQTQISIAIERDNRILRSQIMNVDPVNSSKYFGSINTEDLTSGKCDIRFLAKRIGYLQIELYAGRVFVDRPFPTPIPPNLALWGLLAATVAIFISSAVLIRLNLKES